MKTTYTVSHGANSRGIDFIAEDAKNAAMWASLLEDWGHNPLVKITRGEQSITIDNRDTDGDWTPSVINCFAKILA